MKAQATDFQSSPCRITDIRVPHSCRLVRRLTNSRMKYLILLSVAMTLSFVRCGQGHHQGTTVGGSRKHGLPTCSVDSTDANEERAFGVPTAPPLREMMRGQAPEMKLSLPQIASDSPVLPASLPASSQLVILVPGGDDVYAYTSGNIQNARKYSYQQLTDLLKAKSTDTACWVLLRPAATATYRNTVDLLDILQKTGIKHYVLVDITKEEKDYLKLHGN